MALMEIFPSTQPGNCAGKSFLCGWCGSIKVSKIHCHGYELYMTKYLIVNIQLVSLDQCGNQKCLVSGEQVNLRHFCVIYCGMTQEFCNNFQALGIGYLHMNSLEPLRPPWGSPSFGILTSRVLLSRASLTYDPFSPPN